MYKLKISFDLFQKILMSTHVVLVLGQTGVGKSSLINGIKDETTSGTK